MSLLQAKHRHRTAIIITEKDAEMIGNRDSTSRFPRGSNVLPRNGHVGLHIIRRRLPQSAKPSVNHRNHARRKTGRGSRLHGRYPSTAEKTANKRAPSDSRTMSAWRQVTMRQMKEHDRGCVLDVRVKPCRRRCMRCGLGREDGRTVPVPNRRRCARGRRKR